MLFGLLSLVPSWTSITTLVALSLSDDRYSYVLVMPAISLGLFFLERDRIFAAPRYGPKGGLPILFAGGLLYVATRTVLLPIRSEYGLWLQVLAVVLVWIAGFVIFYGPKAAQAATAPLIALLLTAPIPINLMHRAEIGLQYASADMAHMVFKLIGIPVFRQGLIFSLPGMEIEVAEQCSGIRSTTAVLITVAMASHLFLRSKCSKLTLILLTIPIAIFKNAVRIATLSWLSVYVSRDIMTSPLHRQGGLPFTMVALAILIPLILLFRRFETVASRALKNP